MWRGGKKEKEMWRRGRRMRGEEGRDRVKEVGLARTRESIEERRGVRDEEEEKRKAREKVRPQPSCSDERERNILMFC